MQVVKRDEQLWEQHRERAQALFADADLQVEFAGVAGEPAQELVDAAEQRQADLIIVGTREPGFSSGCSAAASAKTSRVARASTS